MTKRIIWIGMMLIGVGLLVVACTTPTPAPTLAPPPTTPPEPTGEPVPVKLAPEVPYLANWEGSAHNAVDTEPFRHWDEDDPAEVPTTCAKCHSTAGYRDFLGADGSEAGKVDAAVPAQDAQGVQCVACHNPVTLRKTTVVFPSGVEITAGDDTRCMECHQGRESKVSVDQQITDFNATDPDAIPAPITDAQGNERRFGFRNVHYFAAAATLYGSMVHGGYEYDGKTYDAKHTHVEGYATCTGCHDQHTLQVRVEQCATCHEGVASVEDLKNVRMVSSNPDYDGDGDAEEGMYYEVQGLQEILLAEIQKYAQDVAGAEIQYDGATFPYFLGADGEAYPNWTPRLLKAAYNYQVSQKDPGAFAHGNKYIVQLLYDSIEDLGGDVSGLARTDAAHFAGDTLPFRDWDADDYTVPFRCVKCHTAQGMPTFVKNGGSVVVDGRGTTVTTGVGAMPSSNGFMCTTCHNAEAFPERYAIAQVTFPSGKTLSFAQDADGKNVADDSNLCILCHQGRESSTSVDNYLSGKEDDTPDGNLSFKNIHYLSAGATLFGAEAAGGYQYAGKIYVGQNMHAQPTGAVNKCKDCHDVHALEPKVETCQGCHGTDQVEEIRAPGDTVDYDGDGDTTEGTKGEMDTLAEALYAQIQTYAETTAGTPIVYDTHSFPYFFVDADKNGEPDQDDEGASVRYNAFTPRLMRAAYNYQYSQKDPGAFIHNPKYVFELLIDSIADLGGDVSAYTRPEAPAQ
ncbi:MAG TPA: cytochrome c3 family protein [Anaerolineae bacterium]|nr:cytochrome c3 family protein [Anaerolineae bacterium]